MNAVTMLQPGDSGPEKAPAKRGPKTAKGKRAVAKNATRHGIFAKVAVVPGVERQKDWERHWAGLIESLAPVGAMEEILVERIAFAFWRLGRVARHERDAIADQQIGAERRVFELRARRGTTPSELILGEAPTCVSTLREKLRLTRAIRRFLKQLADAGPDNAVNPGMAYSSIKHAIELFCNPEDSAFEPFFSSDEDISTASEVRKWLELVAERADEGLCADNLGRLLLLIDSFTKAKCRILEDELAEVEKAIGLERGARILPRENDMEKIRKYEAHLERLYLKNLHELQRLQAARLSGAGPMPAAVDVTICSDEIATRSAAQSLAAEG